jgi:hypothetical protein
MPSIAKLKYLHRGVVLLDCLIAMVLLGFSITAIVVSASAWHGGVLQRGQHTAAVREQLSQQKLQTQIQEQYLFLAIRARAGGE